MAGETDNEPKCAADVICFRFVDDTLQILLVERKYDPYKHHSAFPGGFVEPNETIREAAARELKEETDLSPSPLRQFRSFGGPDRDPRGPIVTVCYTALFRPDEGNGTAASDARDLDWCPALDPPDLAFDHATILNHALESLRNRFLHTPDAFRLLPDPFPLDQARSLYRHVCSDVVDRQTFYRRLVEPELIQPVGNNPADASPYESNYVFNTETFAEYRNSHLPLSGLTNT